MHSAAERMIEQRTSTAPTPFRLSVIIPAWNEEDSIGHVINALPRCVRRDRVVVVDNNSTDGTADVARRLGATIVPASRQGYGSACLAGIEHLASLPIADQPAIVVFIDADYSDHPEQLPLLVEPILQDRADLVIGSRTLKPRARRALLPQAVFGNWLACFLMRMLFGHRYTDLGPFRAISRAKLLELQMRDPDFGWTVEMQIKAIQRRLRIREVAVDYRARIGQSKITGTPTGTVRAGIKILWTIFRYGLERRRAITTTTKKESQVIAGNTQSV
jgi:glycosyltransferase involved in cell wall biosynthesis